MAEEEEASAMAIAMAGTLLGAISFQMGLFYITNHSDEDIRKYGYDIINSTVSIFAAVLLFQTFNSLMEVYVLDGLSMELSAAVDMAHMLGWYIVMQIALAWISGVHCRCEDDPAPCTCGRRPKSIEGMELDLKSIAVLLAHMTGFASINAWGAIQQLDWFRANPWRSFSVLPIAFCGQFILQRITDCIRERVSLLGDGHKDKFEKAWDEETEECENDVMALTLSFNFTQAVRYLVTEDLPNQEGAEPFESLIHHSSRHITQLFVTGFVAAFVMVIMFMMSDLSKMKEEEDAKKEGEEEKEEEEEPGLMEELCDRLKDVAILTLSMCFAWCTFFSSKMQLGKIHLVDDEMVLAMSHTMAISLVSFSSIRVLDKLADADWTPEWIDDAIKQFIKGPLSILVGFGWEQCFDQAVDSLSTVLPDPHLSKGVLAVLCVIIVVPAWKWYLLPMELQDGWQFGFVINDKDQPEVWDGIFYRLLEKQVHKEEKENDKNLLAHLEEAISKSKDPAKIFAKLEELARTHGAMLQCAPCAPQEGDMVLTPTRTVEDTLCYRPLPGSADSVTRGTPLLQEDLRAAQMEAEGLRKWAAQQSSRQAEEIAELKATNAKLKSTLRDALATLQTLEGAQQKRMDGLNDLKDFMTHHLCYKCLAAASPLRIALEGMSGM